MRRDASVGVDLYGRDVSASKALNGVGQSADKLAHKINDVSGRIVKGMAMAAAAAGTAAVAIGVNAVKAAMEDAKSVAVLEKAIQNSTKATKSQTKAVEEYIDKAQLRFGVEDTKLRTGMGRLVRSTHDVTKAQKLLNTSISLSAASGKDLDTVTAAVSKAYDGNLGALSRLGIGIPKALIKTKDFGKVWEYVREQVRGFAYKEADTLEGRMRRVGIAFDEAKEKLGYMLMKALTPYMEKVTKLIPKLQQWIDANGPKLAKAIKDALPTIQRAIDKVSTLIGWAVDHKDTLLNLGKQLAIIFAAISVGSKIYTTVKALAVLIETFKALRNAAAAASVAEALATGGVNIAAGVLALAGAAAIYAGLNYALSLPEQGQKPPVILPLSSTGYIPNQGIMPALRGGGAGAGTTTNITLNVAGSVTSEGQLVQKIKDALKNDARRNGRGD